MENNLLVPAGHRAIVFKTDISPDLMTDIESSISELTATPVPKTQQDVDAVNRILKTAKSILKVIEAERKKITSELDAEKKSITSAIKEKFYDPLDQVVTLWDQKIIEFQRAELARKEQERIALEEEKKKEQAAIAAEHARITSIKDSISSYKTNALTACANATIDNIDSYIYAASDWEPTADEYFEFLGEMKIVCADVVNAFKKKKIDLERIKELEAINKKAADDAKKKQQEEDAARVLASTKEKEVQQEIQQDILENKLLNSEMGNEFKKAQVSQVSGIMRRWVFEEDTINMSLLPDEFKTFDKAKIKDAISKGARDIPGVVIKQDISNVSR